MSILLENAISKLHTLDEAFSDTMPDWMRQGFQSFSKHRKGNFNTPVGPSRYGSRYQGEQNLFNLLLKAGYDVSKMNVVTAPVPNKLDDEIFDNPDALPVFHIVTPNDNKIWIQGINDQEQFIDENGKESKFSYMNNAKLKKYVTDFAYIDLSAPETHSVEKQTDPREMTHYSGKPVNYRKASSWSGDGLGLTDKSLQNRRFKTGVDTFTNNQYGDRPQEQQFDRSGYFRGSGIISDRLRKALKNYKNTKIPERIFKVEQELIDLRDDLDTANRSSLFSYDLRDDSARQSIENSRSLMQQYSNLIYNFNSYITDIVNEIKANPNEPVRDYTASKVANFELLVKDLKDKLKPYRKSIFVW